MNTLMIIESPGKKATLEKILGPDFTVRASFGHIRDLPKPDIPSAKSSYQLNYEISERAKGTVDALQRDVAKSDRVLIATDPDREGEAIAWHLMEVLGIPNAERVTYQEITPNAVRAGVAAPRPIDMNLVRAQETRRGADRVIGYKASQAISKAVGEKVTAGRVQSPALSLVVLRDRQIRAFTRTNHFGAKLLFGDSAATWSAAWKPVLAEGQVYVLDEAVATAAAATRVLRVTAFTDNSAKKAPPGPFNTAKLQQRAHVALKFKPKHTMDLAQKLYEQGLITYMRTDSPNLSGDAFVQIAAYAAANQLPIHSERRTWKAKASAQEAHEAIRPTHFDVVDGGTTPDEKALYRLIWERAVGSQLADAVYAVRTAILEAADHKGDLTPAIFQARGQTLIEKGWKAIFDDDSDDEGDDDKQAEANNPVPLLELDQLIEARAGEVIAKATKPPTRYTLATLTEALEKHGIGRPSTYATILDAITVGRGYLVEDAKGFLNTTPLAEIIVDRLIGTYSFVELDYTRDLETELDNVAEGVASYIDVMAKVDQLLSSQLANTQPPRFPCQVCGSPMRKRDGKDAPFWSCSGYPECRTTLPDANGVPGVRAVAKPSEHVCTKCTKPLRHLVKSKEDDAKGRGWNFWVCTGGPACTEKYQTGPDNKPVFV